jgi:chromate transporter
VLVIVVEALIRIGKRALKTRALIALAGLAFVGIFFLALPFPLIVIGAGVAGYLIARFTPEWLALKAGEDVRSPADGRWRQFIAAAVIGLL